jgi:hypothetical protein
MSLVIVTKQNETKQHKAKLTIAITVEVAFITFTIIIKIFLSWIFDSRTVITQVTKSIFIVVILISVRDIRTIVLFMEKKMILIARTGYNYQNFLILTLPDYSKLCRYQYHCHTYLPHYRYLGLFDLGSLSVYSYPVTEKENTINMCCKRVFSERVKNEKKTGNPCLLRFLKCFQSLERSSHNAFSMKYIP